MPSQAMRADAEVRNGSLESVRAAGQAVPVDSRSITIAFPFEGSVIGGSHISAMRLIQNLDRRFFRPLVMLPR